VVSSTEVIPSARRLVNSLRDLGYDLSAALADLIDNSIAAGARNISIDTRFEGEDSWLRVADDGIGMTPSGLREAMRFGTRRPYDDDDLGKFGLGLKSASLSQCRRLTVASRTAPAGRITVARWDLDHVEECDRWEVLRLSPGDCPLASEPLRCCHGTVVLWEILDRVMRYRIPDGRRAQSDFDRLTDEIRAVLAMTFHRFLSGEAKHGRRVQLIINGDPVGPWDPFARDEPATTTLPVQRLPLEHDGRRRVVKVSPYILPTEACFSSLVAHRRAAGPRFWTRQQGLYFYRNDRLIQAGGWSRLRTQDEHTKLARLAVEIPGGLDEAFELNISKTQVRIPHHIKPQLAAIASSVCRLGEDVYRRPRNEDTPSSPAAAEHRLAAVTGLIRMVLAATEDVLDAELSQSVELRDRLVARLRDMESDFLTEMAGRLGIGIATIDA
jgi:hypothetical protein